MYAKKEEYWLNIKNGKYKRADNPAFENLDTRFPGTYIKVKGDEIVERYLDDDLEETLLVDDEFNQGTFLLASMIPTTYERASTLGTATIWKLIMLAWSYKYKLAIPEKQSKQDFVGGLSRLLKVGYSTNILKLDYSSLYPSIQLVHDVFPDCDIMNGMKSMLTYFRTERIKNKNLASEWKSKDKKISQKFDRLQLPLKIFINSLFGALSAPQVFHWGDMKQGEMITCTGRQYLRQMLKFFISKGYNPVICDTDGINYSLPPNVEERIYIGVGTNPQIEKGKEYKGYDADVAEFNDLFMKSPMFLDCDGTWSSCINLSRKNYATLEHNGKIKLTGNSIKSKKLPLYIEDFLDKGIKMLLEGKGQEFVEWYYEYVQKIFDQQIPLMKIAQRAKVKLSMKEYEKRCNEKTKAGNAMSRMAHMELALKNKIKVNLGDVIYYVNNGVKASHGDVQKVNKPKKGWTQENLDDMMEGYGKIPLEMVESFVKLNCYMLDRQELENNPELKGEYNIPRAISVFNKRIEPLLVVFKQEVREGMLITDPEARGLFTKEQCDLINGIPFEPEDQDTIEDLLKITDEEYKFWNSVGKNPNHIYDLAEEGWEKYIL
jgi:DNA polymerase elongation subunit (family B)